MKNPKSRASVTLIGTYLLGRVRVRVGGLVMIFIANVMNDNHTKCCFSPLALLDLVSEPELGSGREKSQKLS